MYDSVVSVVDENYLSTRINQDLVSRVKTVDAYCVKFCINCNL